MGMIIKERKTSSFAPLFATFSQLETVQIKKQFPCLPDLKGVHFLQDALPAVRVQFFLLHKMNLQK